jgi:hypothetical protein
LTIPPLRHGQADLPWLRASLRRLSGEGVQLTEWPSSGVTSTAGAAGTRRAIALESAALVGFALLAAAAALLLVANLAAAGPGWAAARIRPAAALRSEEGPR